MFDANSFLFWANKTNNFSVVSSHFHLYLRISVLRLPTVNHNTCDQKSQFTKPIYSIYYHISGFIESGTSHSKWFLGSQYKKQYIYKIAVRTKKWQRQGSLADSVVYYIRKVLRIAQSISIFISKSSRPFSAQEVEVERATIRIKKIRDIVYYPCRNRKKYHQFILTILTKSFSRQGITPGDDM